MCLSGKRFLLPPLPVSLVKHVLLRWPYAAQMTTPQLQDSTLTSLQHVRARISVRASSLSQFKRLFHRACKTLPEATSLARGHGRDV